MNLINIPVGTFLKRGAGSQFNQPFDVRVALVQIENIVWGYGARNGPPVNSRKIRNTSEICYDGGGVSKIQNALNFIVGFFKLR